MAKQYLCVLVCPSEVTHLYYMYECPLHCCCCWDFSSSPEFNLYLYFEVIVPPLGLACAWSRPVVFRCGFTWTIYIYLFLKKWIFKTAKYWKIKSQWCSMSSSLCSFKPCRPSWSWAWSCNGPTYMATSDARSVEDPICRHWLRTILVHSFSSRYTLFFFSLKIFFILCCDSYANIFFLICLFN